MFPHYSPTIVPEDKHLLAEFANGVTFPIFAESETKFFAKVLDAQITFVKEGGAVTHLILTQNGQPQRAPRMP